MPTIRRGVIGVLVVCCVIISGCGKSPRLPATPNLYTQGDSSVLMAAAERDRTTEVEILFATDRKRVEGNRGRLRYYDERRSDQLVLGRVVVGFGGDASWEELLESSLAGKGGVIKQRLIEVEEIVEFPTSIPLPVWRNGVIAIDSEHIARVEDAERVLQEAVGRRLEKSEIKDVYIYIHGVGNSFEDAVHRMAQLWYFMGRPGVAMVYSWPAKKGGGPLRGYTYSRESSEYTVHHLRQFLLAVSSTPGLEQVHILAHSRGTGITLAVLQQLRLLYDYDIEAGRRELKLGQIVLAAPDIDWQVAQQLYRPDRVDELIDWLTIYLTPKDGALGIAEWLFGGLARLGSMKGVQVKPESIEALQDGRMKLDGIRVETKRLGAHRHTYWVDNPAVLSDVILVLRDGRKIGSEHGRPLLWGGKGLWMLKDGYPYEGEHAPTAEQ